MRGCCGHTLVEVTVAASLVAGIVLFATTTSSSLGETSSYGQNLLQVQSENQAALWYMANDLQNGSSDTDPVTNEPRFELLDDDQAYELKTRTAESAANGDTSDYVPATESETSTSGSTTTSGTCDDGTTRIGTTNREADSDGQILDGRPRLLRVVKNSRFIFRKVIGYEVNSLSGEVKKLWSTPVTYFVRKRHLIRAQDGVERVIGRNVSIFKVFARYKGNFTIVLRTQKRNASTGEVLTASGRIEVNPKNQ